MNEMIQTPTLRATKASSDFSGIAEAITKVGHSRGFALNCGMLAVLCTTAESDDEHAALTAEFLTFREKYMSAVSPGTDVGDYLSKFPDLAPHRRVAHDFCAALAALPDDRVDMTRTQAADLARCARCDVLPATYIIINRLSDHETEQIAQRLIKMQEKSALVDGMLAEMTRIGRMIGLISINASVEAARAGGESGRSFQVIAEEVRSLARQSSDVLGRMKHRISEDDGDVVKAGRHTTF